MDISANVSKQGPKYIMDFPTGYECLAVFYSIDIYVEYDTSIRKGDTEKTSLDTKWFDYETRLLVLMWIVSSFSLSPSDVKRVRVQMI